MYRFLAILLGGIVGLSGRYIHNVTWIHPTALLIILFLIILLMAEARIKVDNKAPFFWLIAYAIMPMSFLQSSGEQVSFTAKILILVMLLVGLAVIYFRKPKRGY